jgi:hypothetical protein
LERLNIYILQKARVIVYGRRARPHPELLHVTSKPGFNPSLVTLASNTMFARKIRVEYEAGSQRHPAPLKWLDSFAMRNFTNDQVFDDTLPAGDGVLEVGARVPLDRLKTAMEDWFRRKGYLKPGATLLVAEIANRQP